MHEIIKTVSGFIWGPPLMILLLGTGLFLSIRFKFVQLRMLKHGLSLVTGKWDDPKYKGEITHFQALATALSGTIGTGNIAGVATAISAGGPGAVFWMWVTAVFGMCLKFTSCLLSHKYREAESDGEIRGGPMFYLRNGINFPPLAYAYAIFTIIASFGIGNMVQANSVAEALKSYVGIPKIYIGIVLSILVACVIIGGIKRIAKFASTIVPIMAVSYVICALIIIFMNFTEIPAVIGKILSSAFGFKSAIGGVAGHTVAQAMRFGIARGLFSNEGGLGSAAMAHAAAKTDEPVREGLVAMLGPMIDTLIICSMTAFIIILYGDTSGVTGASLTAGAFEKFLPGFGQHIVSWGLILFAFTTMIGWSYYGETAMHFLTPKHIHISSVVYKALFCILLAVGAAVSIPIVWGFSDIANALMAFPNLLALIILSKNVSIDLNDYTKRLPNMRPFK